MMCVKFFPVIVDDYCPYHEMKFGLKIISHKQFRRSFAYYILAVNFVGGEDFGDCDRY